MRKFALILLWLAFSLAAGLTNIALADSGGANLAVAIRPEPAFEHDLERFMEVVKTAKRIEVVVHGPYRQAVRMKNCKECPEYVLDAAAHAKEAQMQAMCRGVLDSIKSGAAQPPKPVASLVLESDVEPYYQLVSGIVRDYWKTIEPFLRREVFKTENKEKAEWVMREIRRELEKDFLDRNQYLIAPRQITWHPEEWSPWEQLSRRALYMNGMAPDGRKRYLQLIYTVYAPPNSPLDFPVKGAARIRMYDIEPDGFIKSGSAYNAEDDKNFLGEIMAIGVVAHKDLALPWMLMRPNEVGLVIPTEFRHEKWRYVADIESADRIYADRIYAHSACTYLIQ